MFGGRIGMGELVIIFLIVLLLFGGRRLPEIARSIGRSLNEFKKGREDGPDSSDKDKKPDA